MTTTQKVSWINEKISSLIKEIKNLKIENNELQIVATKENEALKRDLTNCKDTIKSKDTEIRQLKDQLKQREAEIDDVVAKIDLLINS